MLLCKDIYALRTSIFACSRPETSCKVTYPPFGDVGSIASNWTSIDGDFNESVQSMTIRRDTEGTTEINRSVSTRLIHVRNIKHPFIHTGSC